MSTSSDRPKATEPPVVDDDMLAQVIRRGDAMGARYEAALKNQRDTIDRILGGKGWSYDQELQFLQVELAKALGQLRRIDVALGGDKWRAPAVVAEIKKIRAEA